MQNMIQNKYKDQRTLKRRINEMKTWLKNPELLEADSDANYAHILEINLKYNSLDHFGIIPHLGYFLLGCAIAFTCYKIKTVKEEMANISETELATQKNTNTQSSRKYAIFGFLDNYKDNPLVKGIAWIGKRSMMFYIVHFTILYCLFKIIQINKVNVTIE